MEQSLGRVRANLRFTGYVFRPHAENESQLTMTFLGQADPRGYLPTSVVNLASISQALNIGRVRDLYIQYNAVQKELDVPYPLDCYQLGRRGGTCIHTVPLVAPETGLQTFFVRLQGHSERNITVKVEKMVGLSAVQKDEMGEKLVAGKEVTFGGTKLLDIVVQVTLEQEEKMDLDLQFTNPNWSKTYLVLPVSMAISKSDPTSSAEAAAATAEQ